MKEEMEMSQNQKNQMTVKEFFFTVIRLIIYATLCYFIKQETGGVTAMVLLFVMIYIEVNASTTSLLKAMNNEQLKILDIIFKWNRKHDLTHNGSENLEDNSSSNLMEKA